MDDIWEAARVGAVGEVERLGQDPGLLNARNGNGRTALMYASMEGHLGIERWLADQGAAMNEWDECGCTALHYACYEGHAPVMKLLLERGADPTISREGGMTPLMIASFGGHLEVVRFLLGLPSAGATVNHRNSFGETALWLACHKGRGRVARLLLASGADPTIAKHGGITPMAIARRHVAHAKASVAEGYRECVAALEVSYCSASCLP
jgi:uncharacterized protein